MLMEETECAKCLYTTGHPFGLILDDEGVCGGCRNWEQKASLDWEGRFEKLRVDLTSRNGKDYDCVVPLQGTPEYFYLIHILQEKLGLSVLGVVFNNHFNTQVGIRNLARLREVFNLDCLQFSPEPHLYRKLVRESIFELGSLRWPALAGERAYVLNVSIRLKIPTIVWPWHQPTEQVGAFSYLEEVEMSRAGWHSYDLMGREPHEMATASSTIRRHELDSFRYPDDRVLDSSGVKGIYLSNFLPWDTRAYSEYAVSHLGALGARQIRTFDVYDRPNDFTYMALHDLLKKKNVGYSRVRDSLVREIRFGRLGKAPAREIENFFDNRYPERQIEEFAQWLGTSNQSLVLALRSKFPGIDLLGQEPILHRDSKTELKLSEEASKFCQSYEGRTESFVMDSSMFNVGKGLQLNERIEVVS